MYCFIDSSAKQIRSFRLVLRCLGLSPCRVLKQCGVDGARGQVYISNDRATDEHILCRALQLLAVEPNCMQSNSVKYRLRVAVIFFLISKTVSPVCCKRVCFAHLQSFPHIVRHSHPIFRAHSFAPTLPRHEARAPAVHLQQSYDVPSAAT